MMSLLICGAAALQLSSFWCSGFHWLGDPIIPAGMWGAARRHEAPQPLCPCFSPGGAVARRSELFFILSLFTSRMSLNETVCWENSVHVTFWKSHQLHKPKFKLLAETFLLLQTPTLTPERLQYGNEQIMEHI